MASPRRFSTASGEVLVEVNDSGLPGINADDLMTLLAPIGAVARGVGDLMKAMPKESAPDKVQLTLGLTALENGGVVVALGTTNANLNVTLTWGDKAGGGMADLASLIPG